VSDDSPADMTWQLAAALDAVVACHTREGESRDEALRRLRQERPWDLDRVRKARIRKRDVDPVPLSGCGSQPAQLVISVTTHDAPPFDDDSSECAGIDVPASRSLG
jgi:hypothetical protein